MDASNASLTALPKQQRPKPILLEIPSNLDDMSADAVADAFLFSEELYVQDGLRVLANGFEKRLRIHSKLRSCVLTAQEIDTVFRNVSNIFAVNQSLYQELLHARLANQLTDSCGRILSTMIPFFKLYAAYITSQRTAAQFISTMRKRKSRVDEFLVIEEKCAGWSIAKLLAMPTDRLPQYIVFLTALYKKLESSSKPAEDTMNAIFAIQLVTDHISENVKHDSQRKLVVRFQENEFRGTIALVAPSRLVLRYGPLQKIFSSKRRSLQKSKRYMFILCNDCIIYSTFSTAVQSAKVKHVLQLEGVNVRDVSLHNGDPLQNAFLLTSSTKSFVVIAAENNEKMQWMQAISNAVENNDDIQRGLAGQPVPADGNEFEKMIMKKKHRTIIRKADPNTQRGRTQSLVELDQKLLLSYVPDKPTKKRETQTEIELPSIVEQTLSSLSPTVASSVITEPLSPPPPPPPISSDESEENVAEQRPANNAHTESIDFQNMSDKFKTPSFNHSSRQQSSLNSTSNLPAAPAAPAAPPPALYSHGRTSSMPELSTTQTDTSQLMQAIRTGTELKHVNEQSAINRARSQGAKNELFGMLQQSLERYRDVVQVDVDDESDNDDSIWS